MLEVLPFRLRHSDVRCAESCKIVLNAYQLLRMRVRNAFSRVASTTLKIAVVAPMPNAIVITAINANAGALRSCRRANLKSFISFAPEGLDWIDFRSASRRDIAGQ